MMVALLWDKQLLPTRRTDDSMCLAIPMKILERRDQTGTVEFGGARKEIMLTLTPEARVGEYVIVHAGYALEVLDEQEAERTLALLRELVDPEL
jgi:hydrogenase expression/formation protein HypC